MYEQIFLKRFFYILLLFAVRFAVKLIAGFIIIQAMYLVIFIFLINIVHLFCFKLFYEFAVKFAVRNIKKLVL